MRYGLTVFVCALCLWGHCEIKAAPVFHPTDNPKFLAAWGMVEAKSGHLVLGERVVPYDLNMPLFTDYAHKLRTMWLPQGRAASYREKGVLDFPVGTVITKTFYYFVPSGAARGDTAVARVKDVNAMTPRDFAKDFAQDFDGRRLNLKNIRLMETRLLIRRKSGWVALPYIWNQEQTQARLQRIGGIVKLNLVDPSGERPTEAFPYVIPNTNQCAGCHTVDYKARKLVLIGLKARQLNRAFAYETGLENQLIHWARHGYLKNVPRQQDFPRNANWGDRSASLEERARAYLDTNCAHCHNKAGVADMSGLHLELETGLGPALGVCKLPIAAGSGTGGRHYGIVPGRPDESILLYRMMINDPAAQMPELGRSTVHQEAIILIRDWIAAMKGACQ